MTYALDTNTVIMYLRNLPAVLNSFDNTVKQGDKIVIPEPVHYEIKRGFRILSAVKKERVYNELISAEGNCCVKTMDALCWRRAEHIYAELYRKGFTVGELDILIAAICIENNCTLVTNNEKHFKDINGLLYQNWENG
jgi:predicted nucleic acid-binding protein